jgi:hypothetical protein
VQGRRGFSHYIFITESQQRIKVYGKSIPIGEEIQYQQTLIFATIMDVTLGPETIRLAYVYRGLTLFPGALFITSVLGILFKRNIEFSFNASVVNGLLLIICLYLIL